MMKYLKLFWLPLTIFVLAFSLRFYGFANRAPFDWDQDRDYAQVEHIASGQYIALGPVAKGVGGFYLGSLYYYLLYPAYFLSSGALSSLPLTSIFLDAVVPVFIYLLFKKSLGYKTSLGLATIWSISWLLIEASRISWNVALVPLWTLLTLSTFEHLVGSPNKRWLYLLAFLCGLTIHIHVTAIAIIPMLMIFYYKHFKYSLVDWLIACLVGLIPLLPLALYDLSHSFFNLHLLRDFLGYRTRVDTSLLSMIPMATLKLGKVVSGILFSRFRDSLFVGLTIIIFAIYSLYSHKIIIKTSGLIILISTFLIIVFRDYGFPEYYFSVSYLAIIIVFFDVINHFFGKASYLILAIIILLNLGSYQTSTTGFSLANKTQLVESLKEVESPINVYYNFDPGRDGGLRSLVKRSGLIIDPSAKNRVLLTDKLNTPLYIGGELARDLYQIGNLKSALYVVQ